MTGRRRVAIVQQFVYHYRDRFYELLRDRLDLAGVDLVLIHSNAEAEDDVWDSGIELEWAHRVPARYVNVAGRQLVWQSCGDLLRRCDLVIVEQGSRHLLNYRLFVEQAMGRRALALWGHGKDFNAVDASRLGEAFKARWSRHARWWFAYNELAAQVVEGLGVPRDRITVVNNATDTRALRDAASSLTADDERRTRRRYGLKEGRTALYLGGLATKKRLDYVVAASDVVRSAVPDYQLVVAGAGPQEAVVRELASARPWMHVVGSQHGSDKAALMRISDVFLMPSWAGLAVLDSFAAGLPMIVSGAMPHPPEVSYLEDGINGLIVQDDGDPRRYGEAVVALLEDDDTRRRLRNGCLVASEGYSAEEMSRRFAEGILAALKDLGR